MKKLLTLTLLLSTLLTFSACGGDDKEDNILNNEPETPANPFIGTWEYSVGNYSFMQKGYFDITEDYHIKEDYFIYRDNNLSDADTRDYTYTIEHDYSGEEILHIDIMKGSSWYEARLLRGKLIVYYVRQQYNTGEETRELWTEMTRYAPAK